MDPAAFAEARLDEDEAVIRRNSDGHGLADGFPDYRTYVDGDTDAADAYIEHFDPARALREATANRAILERHRDCATMRGYCRDRHVGPPPCPDLADLLTRWAGHEDYDRGWAP